MADSNTSARPCRRLPWHGGAAAEILASAEALFEGVATSGQPAIRWYIASDEALLLGASQKLSTIDGAAARDAGVALIRRAAGGNVILSDPDMLGFDVALPRGDPLLLSDLTLSYRWLGEVWTAALRGLGVDATLVSLDEARASVREEGEGAALARATCFGGLSPFEVTAPGRKPRKLVGLAQVRRRHGAIFQCSVPLRWTPWRLSWLMAISPQEQDLLAVALRERAIGLDDARNGQGSYRDLIAAVETALTARGLILHDSAWTREEGARAAILLSERYAPLLVTPPIPRATG